MSSTEKTIVTLPTYNEAGNIGALIPQLLDVDPNLEVLVADDDSPDGTWRIAQEMARDNPRIHVLHRTENPGRGSAGREAFQKALDMGADVVVEMDADLSHSPGELPQLLDALKDADLVIGSRLLSGGEDMGRGAVRGFLTHATNMLNRLLLRVPVRDCNSGYRIYRRDVLLGIDLPSMVSVGPEIVPEVLIRADRRGFRIIERPIHFMERSVGKSNLTFGKLLRVLRFVVRLSWMDRRGRLFKNGSEA